MPIKLKLAADIIVPATDIVACTIIGPIALGNICLNIILRSPVPQAFAASINSNSTIGNIADLIILVKPGTLAIVIAINRLVKFVPKAVDIYIPINEYTERKFEIPITVINVPGGIDVKFFPSSTDVSFSVTLEDYKRISQDDFAIVLDYNSFYKNENGRVELSLTTEPESIRNAKLSTQSVEFLLEKGN